MIDRMLAWMAWTASWITWTACWLAVSPLFAQAVRLPMVMPPSEPYPDRASPAVAWEPDPTMGGGYSMGPVIPVVSTTALTSRPGSSAELPPTQWDPPLAPAELPPLKTPEFPLLESPEFPSRAPEANPDRPPDARDGMFQKLMFTHAWLASGDDENALGIHDSELKMVLALPIPSRRWPLLITPGFAVHAFDGPVAPDLPPRVYDAYTQFRSLGKINPRLGAELAVTLGAFGDFQQSTDESFRITGHGAMMWEWRPRAKIVLGAAYINTHDTDVIPIGGLIWEPHDDLIVEAVFPRPKIAKRLHRSGTYSESVKDWLYVAGEFGNDTWAVRRSAGFDDEVNYRDWRVLLGLERKAIGRPDYQLEIGYIFSRTLHYKSTAPEFPIADTFMLRAGVIY